MMNAKQLAMLFLEAEPLSGDPGLLEMAAYFKCLSRHEIDQAADRWDFLMQALMILMEVSRPGREAMVSFENAVELKPVLRAACIQEMNGTLPVWAGWDARCFQKVRFNGCISIVGCVGLLPDGTYDYQYFGLAASVEGSRIFCVVTTQHQWDCVKRLADFLEKEG